MILGRLDDTIPLERRELVARLRWMVELRWLFGAGLVAIGMGLWIRPFEEVHGALIVAIGVGILLYNALFRLLEHYHRAVGLRVLAQRAPLAAAAQITFDLVALTVVLHAAGGIENPFFAYYVFHMVIATFLMPVRQVFALAGVAVILFTTLALAEMKGWLPHASITALQRHYQDPGFVAVTLAAFGSAIVIAVFLGTSIARTLRVREAELVRLEAELARRADELERANEALRRADGAKTQYFRKVSHDMKAPLAAQQSLLRALAREVRDLPPRSRTLIERAIARGDELLAILGDLLTLSRVRDATRPPPVECSQPLDRLRPVLEASELEARQKGLEWRLEIQEPLPMVCVEPGALRAIVENLLSNAIKYTPRGGVVALRIAREADRLVIEVRDTGIGIAEEDLPRIGEEFFRTRQAQETGSPGTGLGMAIVRSTVAAMGGQLDVRSRRGEGTVVTVRVPLPAAPDGSSVSAAVGL